MSQLLDSLDAKYGATDSPDLLSELDAKYGAATDAPNLLDELDAKYSPLEQRVDAFNAEHGRLAQFGQSLKRGALNALNLIDTKQLREAGSVAAGEEPTVAAGPLGINMRDRAVMQGRDLQEYARADFLDEFGNIADRTGRISAIPRNPVLDEVGGAETLGAALRALRADPVGAVAGVTGESLPLMAPALAAAPVAGPAVGAAALGASSFAAENQSGFLEELQSQGVDLSDPEALLAAFENPEVVAAADRVGLTRGAIIGALDTASGGLASKTIVPRSLVAGPVRREAANLVAQTGVQAAAGAGGEAAAQLATKGEIESVGDVVLEAVGEAGTAPVEVASFSANRLREALDNRAAKKADAEVADATVSEPVDVNQPAPKQEHAAEPDVVEPEPAPKPEPKPKVEPKTDPDPEPVQGTLFDKDGTAVDEEFNDVSRPGVLLDETEAAQETPAAGSERPLADNAEASSTATTEDVVGSSEPAGTVAESGRQNARGAGPLSYKREKTRQSLYNRVYVDAGKDPAKMQQAGGRAQYNVVSKEVQRQYGFKLVAKDPKLQWREASDALMDAYENLENVAAALNLPRQALSLNGKIPLTLRKSAGGAAAFFMPGTNEIAIVRRNDSYAHELAHAIDFAILEAQVKPKAQRGVRGHGLTGKSRQGLDVAAAVNPKSVGEAFDNLMNAMFKDDAAKAKTIRELELKLEQTTDKKQLSAIRAELRRVRKNQAPESSFYKGLKAIPGNAGKYYRMPTEMFARVTEAYVAAKTTIAGGHTDFATGTDAFYTATQKDLKKIYPQAEDRQRVFDALDNLFNTMRNENLFGEGATPEFRKDSDVFMYVDPMNWDAMEPAVTLPPAERGIVNTLKRQVESETRSLRKEKLELDSRWDASKRMWKDAGDSNWNRALNLAKNGLSGVMFSGAGVFDMMAKRYPKSQAIKQLRARLVTKPGSGTYAGETYQRAVERETTKLINRLYRVIGNAGVVVETEKDGRELRARMTIDGEVPGKSKWDPLAQNLRSFMDSMYYLVQDSGTGIEMGYTPNGYVPRTLDRFAIDQDHQGFLEAAEELYQFMADAENERRKERGQKPKDFDAAAMARHWLDAILIGDDATHDSNSPTTSPFKSRKLPPEADSIMAKYYLANPVEAVENYVGQIVRRLEFAKRFGKDGKILRTLHKQMVREGVRDSDINMLQSVTDIALGRAQSQLPDRIRAVFRSLHVMFLPVMLARATMSSLAEPVTAAIRSGDMRNTYRAFGPMIAQAAARMRGDTTAWAELAEAIGIIGDAMTDQALINRFGGSFGDSKGQQAKMRKFFQRTGLFAYTRASHIGTVKVADVYLRTWASRVISGGERAGAAETVFKEHGIPKAKQEEFAKWLLEQNEVPNIAELDNSEFGDMYSAAVNRFAKETVQVPEALHRPVFANNDVGRLLYGIMGFAFAFQRNVLQRAYRNGKIAIKGVTEDGTKVSTYDRATTFSLGMLPGFAMLYVLQTTISILRDAATNPDRFEDLGDDFWERAFSERMLALGFTRSGFTGAFDPLIQAYTGLKYQKDLTHVMVGAVPGYVAQNAQWLTQPLTSDAKTNTAEYNAAKGFYGLVASPMAVSALTWAPGGPALRAMYGGSMMALTTTAARDEFAETVAGEKGTKND